MRNLNEELEKLIEFAKANENIRALVLQGSFVNENAPIDDFSDLDPLFFVKDLSEFIENDEWKNQFGNPISFFHDDGIIQDNHKWYTRLTLYDDGFKMDFGFNSVESAKFANEMPLYKIYLDKDNIIPKPEVSDERKFYVIKPTESEFLERVNSFFFDTSYVVKALARDEMFFEKYMEQVLKKKIHKLFEWYIGVKYDFKVNTGSVGRYFKRYLTPEEWNLLLATYPDANKDNCVKALRASFDLVRYLGTYIAKELGFRYPRKHEEDMLKYCNDKINTYLSKTSSE
jgi:aminoglycoside 6-adenylyltransferase